MLPFDNPLPSTLRLSSFRCPACRPLALMRCAWNSLTRTFLFLPESTTFTFQAPGLSPSGADALRMEFRDLHKIQRHITKTAQ